MKRLGFRAWNHVAEIMLSTEDLATLAAITSDGKFVDLHDGRLLPNLIPLQWTGVLDKVGTRVYEGDIVEAWSEGYCGHFEVRWRETAAPLWILWPAYQNRQFWHMHASETKPGIWVDIGLRVIGNIYESPELLTTPPDNPTRPGPRRLLEGLTSHKTDTP